MARSAFALALVAVLCGAVLPGSLAIISFAVGPNYTCPTNPLSPCSFYFVGKKGVVPEISISKAIPDTPLTPAVLSNRIPKGVVFVSHSGPELLYKNAPYGTNKFGFNKVVNEIFYLGGKPATLRLRPRAKKIAIRYLANRCILLPIQSAQIMTKDTDEQICEFNPNARNTPCSDYKRCVVFRTKL